MIRFAGMLRLVFFEPRQSLRWVAQTSRIFCDVCDSANAEAGKKTKAPDHSIPGMVRLLLLAAAVLDSQLRSGTAHRGS
jgi:hypothetical protein